MNLPHNQMRLMIGTACLVVGIAGCGSRGYTSSDCRAYYDRVAIDPSAYSETYERNCRTRRRGRSFFFFNTGGNSNRSPSGSFRGGGPGNGK